MPATKDCPTGFQYNLAIHILPAISDEQKQGGQKVSKYLCQDTLIIF